MIIKHVDEATRVIGKSQGFLGLPIRDQIDPLTGMPEMISAWEPTPDELRRLNQGDSVQLAVLGNGHPPVKIEVGPVTVEAEGSAAV